MQEKHLSILTEGGQTRGFGHITRCLAIADSFAQYGFTLQFIIQGDESVKSLFQTEQVILFNWLNQTQPLKELLTDSTCILIDSAQISNAQILDIEALHKPVIFIDDEQRRNVLNKGFVVDWTVLSERKNYFLPRKDKVTYLLGSQYTPLRKAFHCAQQNSIQPHIKKVMITFGGADVRNLSPTILTALNSTYPGLKKELIIGAGFNNKTELETIADSHTRLIYNADTQTMIASMQSCDLAIASGGQTLYELARIGTPTLAILLVDNAQDDTMGWAETGFIKYLGWYNDPDLLSNMFNAIESLTHQQQRKNMQIQAQQYINPQGASLLAKTIIEHLG
ncbi:MAG: hypothetical protein K9L22_07290 [Methylococcaceae bacterium]|nr:hypothetical protein [Methylococcaceae bacterium]